MPRPRNAVPVPRNHKGRAVIDVYEAGVRRTRTLGPWASPEADAEYKRFLVEYAAGSAVRPEGTDVTINEVLLAFLKHAEQYYRRADGTPTNELPQFKQTFRLVRELYGHTPAREFGPLALKALRRKMIDARWSRKLINQRVGRVRRVFKWASSEELLPVTVYQALASVPGLQAGRTTARETAPVEPVDDATVDATLPYLNRYVRGLVEFQRLTGCRPGEACAVRRCDIETGGVVWLYRPETHKTAWRGKRRVIAVGPRAQALLREFFTAGIDSYLFSPRRAVEELHATRAASRKTPRYPSHMRRNAVKRVAAPARSPAEKYTVTAYEHAIARACDKAFPAPEPLTRRDGETVKEWHERLTPAQHTELAAWQSAHRWHPNQLRHLFATRVRKNHGLEAAQVALGHSRADVTQVYAERDEQLAAAVAAKIG